MVGRFGLIVSKLRVLACVLLAAASAAICVCQIGCLPKIRHFPCLSCLKMPAAAEPRDSVFAKAEPALRYHMDEADEAGVSAETQKKIYEQGIEIGRAHV